MSKTERDLSSTESDGALDEMFDDAELELDIADLELESNDDSDLEMDDDDAPDDGDVTSEHTVAHDANGDAALPDTVRVVPHVDDDDTTDLDKSAATIATDDSDVEDVEVEDVDDDAAVAREGESDDDDRDDDRDDADDDADDDGDVSDDILEELRQADIDGPVVPMAPQDDSAAVRRRPRRSADYDPAPVPIPAKVPRVLGRKPRVRKVTRVVRHVDPWSVFKIAIIANIILYIIVLTASVLLWNVANATGTVQNVERFFESFGWNSFDFNGGEMYHAGWVAGLFVVIGFTGLAVLAATLFNLITDLVGGVRFTVLEEEVVETRTSPMRRFVVRRAEPEVPAVLSDGSGAMTREAVVDDAGANARPTR